jgi:small subunit ribosomal protein S13
MARIAGVDLPRNKHIRIALTYIYGIGNSRSASILGSASVEPTKKVSDLNEDEVNRIRQVISRKAMSKAICAKISRCTSSA